MTLVRIHRSLWCAAALTAVFLLELGGAFRLGGAAVPATLMLILLAGFFEARWVAGFLAVLLSAESFFAAPFWVFEIGAAAFFSAALLFFVRWLTGNRFADFLILLGLGTAVLYGGGGALEGEIAMVPLALSLLLTLGIGALAFSILSRFATSAVLTL